MPHFRTFTPKRRLVPTANPTGDDWAHHKPDLKIDFKNRCGYCNSFDGYRHTYFEVDHFVPKAVLKRYKKYSLTEYRNLVYSCKFCNNAKLALWPSRSRKPNNGKVGFVDPCDKTYRSHFYRTDDGGIMWRSELGKWMFTHAFNFDIRQDSIKILWNLDQLEKLIEALTIQLNNHHPTSKQYKNIRSKMGEFCIEYFQFHRELITYYDNI